VGAPVGEDVGDDKIQKNDFSSSLFFTYTPIKNLKYVYFFIKVVAVVEV
jgi:hypothetical protein